MALLRSFITILIVSLHRFHCRSRAFAFVDVNQRHQSRSLSTGAGSTMASSHSIPGISSLPNWRTVNPDASDDGALPFSHHINSTATAAPWSHAAYASSLDLHARITSCTDPYLSPMLASAMHDLEMAYRLYGPYCMVGSYNGGKDACVIFHLMRAAHANCCRALLEQQQQQQQQFIIPRPRVIYFQHLDEFPSVTSLLHSTVTKYDAEMLAFENGTSFPRGLQFLVEKNYPPSRNGRYSSSSLSPKERGAPPYPLAFILGTRKDDPNAGSQGIYAPSSHYMPPFLRVNPILNWTYGHVWHFLRVFELEYCTLYDEGYTSLGTVKDTIPCPALKKADGGYWPAYMLRDWSLERAGRVGKFKNERKSGENDNNDHDGDVSKHQVTMSQTSSTVSLTDASTVLMLSKHERSMSKVINMDDTQPTTSTIADENSLPHPPTVALIVIGDELLKGMTSDANVLSAARALRSYNVPLARVSIISDDSQGIIDEIRRIRKEVDVVITSGGVGPTHDDVTVRSVAEALGLEIEMNYEMAKLLIDKMGNGEMTDGHEEGDEEDLFSRLPEGLRKMASIPSESTLRYLSTDPEKDEWPVLQCSNIFVLPGVPNYFQRQIEQLAAHLSSLETLVELQLNGSKLRRLPSSPLPPRSETYRLVLCMDENSIVSELNATVQANPHVSFGSYPLVDHPTYKTIITLEGRFYNGGYTRNSERLLSRALSDCALGVDDEIESERTDKPCERRESLRQTLYFSKEEMDSNVKIALEDLKSRLPPESIIKVDTNDYLAVDQP
ncbi:hypothetical protein ACHAW6_003738 [Cyclotella cf. meneghiniana]